MWYPRRVWTVIRVDSLFFFRLLVVYRICESSEIVSFSRQYKIFISTHILLNSSGSQNFPFIKIKTLLRSYDDDDLQLFLLSDLYALIAIKIWMMTPLMSPLVFVIFTHCRIHRWWSGLSRQFVMTIWIVTRSRDVPILHRIYWILITNLYNRTQYLSHIKQRDKLQIQDLLLNRLCKMGRRDSTSSYLTSSFDFDSVCLKFDGFLWFL